MKADWLVGITTSCLGHVVSVLKVLSVIHYNEMEIITSFSHTVVNNNNLYLWWKTIEQTHVKNKRGDVELKLNIPGEMLLIQSEMFSMLTTPLKVSELSESTTLELVLVPGSCGRNT